jgi:hypothetical protein
MDRVMRRWLVTGMVVFAVQFSPSLIAQGDLQVLPVQGNVFVLIGLDGNSVVQVGSDGEN